MLFVEYLNKCFINTFSSAKDEVLVYGQNVDAGSRLGGLCKNFSSVETIKVKNTPNSENLLIGMGFGLSLKGVRSVYFLKQLDFVLLGLDHIVNTYNIQRLVDQECLTSLVCIVSDKGYEGPQSSFNSVNSIASMSNVDCFHLTNSYDTENLLAENFFSSKFKIFTVSQTLLSKETITLDFYEKHKSVYQYGSLCETALIYFNHSIQYHEEIKAYFEKRGESYVIFTVNNSLEKDFHQIKKSIKKFKRVIIIDDDKSVNLSSDALLCEINTAPTLKIKRISRFFNDATLAPCPDKLIITEKELFDE